MSRFIPETPAGSVLAHLEADTEQKAWENLLKETGHMYEEINLLKKRGYRVVQYAKEKKGKR